MNKYGKCCERHSKSGEINILAKQSNCNTERLEQLLQWISEDDIGKHIKITDNEIKDEEVPEAKEPNIYGVKDVEKEEKAVMTKMRPETAIYSDLDWTEIDSDIEATLAKLRWTEMEKENEYEEAEIMDRTEHSDRDKMDLVEMESRLVWNESDNSIDMGRAKATDMRGNKRIKLPPELDNKKENYLQTHAALWRQTIGEY